MTDLLALATQTFLTMVVVMDPVGLAPVFISLAGSRPSFERRKIAIKAISVAAGIIFLFAFFGEALLHHLGISIHSFKIAGGILLFLIALDMVFARPSGAKETEEEEKEAQNRQDPSVFPLAIPLIAGPGTLASIMILSSKASGHALDILVVIGVTVVVLALCYLALRLSGQIAKVIGLTGVHVVTRVLGVLLGALAVQYVADGAWGIIQSNS
ncbi:MarC family protein [Deinococcus cellulosilyticus]|uniref:UPF0056 membrane protein n=1 Tax=Deinococcus cellulosilyticus (strain DSM 18568 / NBRC 106333 / KACC 11606 / 5516J-15) TaxID=1223518 RepID=A0A511N496_DEIC1|nr:UPF0056 membrane protein [Deinococcus cellulosilyticus NBRC 106333 = KACC 11606]